MNIILVLIIELDRILSLVLTLKSNFTPRLEGVSELGPLPVHVKNYVRTPYY